MNSRLITLLATLLAWPAFALAQGSLTPTAAPEPTMKTLQQLWDEIQTVKTQNVALATQNADLRFARLGLFKP